MALDLGHGRRLGLLFASAVCAACVLPGAASAATSANLNGGTLTIASDAGDALTVDCNGTNVTLNATSTGVACTAVTTLIINGGPAANVMNESGLQVGELANLVPPVQINGNGGGDTITGTQVVDVIDGGTGDDSITPQAGGDIAHGGDDNDTFTTTDESGPGNGESVDGGNGTNDRIVISGNLCQGIIISAATINTIAGPISIQGLEGATFNSPFQENTFDLTDAPFGSIVNGSGSNDVVWSSAFNDTLNGNGQGIADYIGAKTNGSLTLTTTSLTGPTVGNDTISGFERAQFMSPSALGGPTTPVDKTWDASAFTGPVEMQAGAGNDVLIGGSGSDTLGAPNSNPIGVDEIGDDTFTGNGGSNTVRGGPGTDILSQPGVATATVGASAATLSTGNTSYTNLEIVALAGTPAADTMAATAFGGKVALRGLGGIDTLTGTAQNDRISGGDGADVLTAGGGTDALFEAATGPTDATLTNTSLTGFGGTDTLSGFEAAELTGSAGDDILNASAFTFSVTLDGADGNDQLTGAAGADTLLGGAGDDTLTATDSVADTEVNCGDGTDSTTTDPVDPAPIACETVNGVTTGGGGGGGGEPGGGSGTPGGETGAPGGPTGTPAVVDTTAPAVKTVAGRVVRGKVPLKFTCPATEARCSGKFKLRMTTRAGRSKVVVIGRGSFSVAGGKSVTVKVKLSRAARAALAKLKKLKVTLALNAADAAGNSKSSTVKLTLKPAKKR